MTKLLAVIAVVALSVLNSVALLVIGWGLQPRSWMAIVGFGLVGTTITNVIARSVLNDED
jgi:hypothetical protein